MEGLASLSVKSMLPTSCCNITKPKEYLVDIEKREVNEGDNHQLQDKQQTLLLKLTETLSRNQISIVAHVHLNNIKEMLKLYEGSGRGFCWPPWSVDAVNFKQENVMLVLAMLTAAVTFSTACTFTGMVSKNSETTERDYYWGLIGSFVLLNSAGFIASVAIIISVLHKFPLKPWPQISVCSWFGSYMCLMMKLSPHEALVLLCVSAPFLVLAAAGKLFRFSQ